MTNVCRARTIPHDGVIRFLAPFNQERLLICGQEALFEVLYARYQMFPKPGVMQYILGRVLGNGVFISEGPQHKLQRKHIAPAFSHQKMKNLYPLIWEAANSSVSPMKSAVQQYSAAKICRGVRPSAPIDIKGWATRVTLDSIGIAGFRKQFRTTQGQNEEFYKATSCLFGPTDAFLLYSTLLFPSWLVDLLPLQRNLELHEAKKEVRAFLKTIIAEKADPSAHDGNAGNDLLSSMIDSAAFTEVELLEQSMTLLGAGYETTSSAISWAIYHLATNPDVQHQLQREIDGAFLRNDSVGDVTANDVDNLPYLRAVCNEVLRVSSLVPAVARTASSDTTLLGTAVPKDTPLIIVPSTVNCDKTLWGDDSAQFDPDRWLEDRSANDEQKTPKNPKQIRLLTFLHGPRNCIGQALARSEIAYVIAAWVRSFEFAIDHKSKNEGSVTRGQSITSFPTDRILVRLRAN